MATMRPEMKLKVLILFVLKQFYFKLRCVIFSIVKYTLGLICIGTHKVDFLEKHELCTKTFLCSQPNSQLGRDYQFGRPANNSCFRKPV